jgi:glutamate synthase (NADPH/NADH) large chain
MVELSQVRDYDDQDFIIETLKKHIQHTQSDKAKEILRNWYEYVPRFVKVMPFEYKRAMNELKIELIDEKLKSIREDQQLEGAY